MLRSRFGNDALISHCICIACMQIHSSLLLFGCSKYRRKCLFEHCAYDAFSERCVVRIPPGQPFAHYRQMRFTLWRKNANCQFCTFWFLFALAKMSLIFLHCFHSFFLPLSLSWVFGFLHSTCMQFAFNILEKERKMKWMKEMEKEIRKMQSCKKKYKDR